MRASRTLQLTGWIFAGCGILVLAKTSALAGEDVTAVSSRVVSKEYVRTILADGSYKSEKYFLKNGGRYDKPSGDASMDDKSFPNIARVIAEQLGTQNCRPGTDPKTGKLIIVVYWGTTIPLDRGTDHALEREGYQVILLPHGGKATIGGPDGTEVSLEDFEHAYANSHNAGLLGYDWEAINVPQPFRFNVYENELNELQLERYFVVLMAYDSQVFLKQRKYKELWETRFSISTRDTDFTKALPKMAKDASNYFGQDSHGLQHLPEGHVNVGEPKSLGEVEPPQK
jgi:hypothetical protein